MQGRGYQKVFEDVFNLRKTELLSTQNSKYKQAITTPLPALHIRK